MRIFDKLKDYYLRFEDLLFQYVGISSQIETNIEVVYAKIEKIQTINKNRFMIDGLREISELSDYVSSAYSNLKQKFNDMIEQINPFNKYSYSQKISPEKKYSTNLFYLQKTLNKNNVLLDILSGKKGWSWEKREKLLYDYLKTNALSHSAKRDLLNVIESNKYLKKNLINTYKRITNVLKC